MEIKVSDDKKPMTGTWYRSTAESWMLGKVTGLGEQVEVTSTGGLIWHGTVADFARDWELS